MKIFIAHPGTQHIPHLVTGILRAGHDVKYSTAIAFGRDGSWEGIIPKSAYNKRLIKTIPDSIIDRHPVLEPIPAILLSLGFKSQRAYAIRNKLFQQTISDRMIRGYDAMIGFDTSSRIIAERARKAGVPFFLELTTVHTAEKEKWLEYVKTRFPEWPSTILQKPADLVRSEEEEIELASAVSTAAGYVKQTYLKYIRTKKEIVVNPFGADLSEFHPKTRYDQRAKFLFLGAFNAAKGIPVLLEAWKLVRPDADLVLAGYGTWPSRVEVPAGVTVVGRVQKNERERFFHSGDVLICPSLYEGFGIVQMEAAACGLSVISTHNTGGSEFLEEGKEGYLVEAGDVNALAEKISLLSENRDEREQMGRAAAAKVINFTWDRYARQWLDTIKGHVLG
jgi:glycosyltransferase involved in cell wall biosynthesis